jgi:hypothetical protein
MQNQQFTFIFENKKKGIYHFFAVFLLIAQLAFFIYTFSIGEILNQKSTYLLIIVADFILAYLYLKAKKDFTIKVSNNGVEFSGLPYRSFNWAMLNNVIIKDGLLTIDFKNNKLIQQYLPKNNQSKEKDFNDFCKACIEGSI